MNNNRRYRIGKLIETLASAKTELEVIMYEEQTSLDNLPDSFRDSEYGDAMQEAIDNIEEALSYMNDLTTALNEARN